jgi:hypothetical protein
MTVFCGKIKSRELPTHRAIGDRATLSDPRGIKSPDPPGPDDPQV